MDLIGAFIGVFHDNITGAVHHIGVIAQAARHAVVAFSAIQRVIAIAAIKAVGPSVAGDFIVQRIARAVDIIAARKLKVL